MQIFFFPLASIGLILTIYSIRLWLKEFNLKEISEFNLIDQPKTIEFKEVGLYSINLIGIGLKYRSRAKNSFRLSITQPSGKPLKLINPNSNFHFKRKGKMGIEVWRFDVAEKGIHNIEFIGLADFLKKNPFIKSDELLIERKFETDKLKVLIKESVSSWNRPIMIISLLIGINAFFWGLLLGINPDIFS